MAAISSKFSSDPYALSADISPIVNPSRVSRATGTCNDNRGNGLAGTVENHVCQFSRVSPGTRLNSFERRRRRCRPLRRSSKRGIVDADGLKKTFGPIAGFDRLKNDGVALPADGNCGRVKAVFVREADCLTLTRLNNSHGVDVDGHHIHPYPDGTFEHYTADSAHMKTCRDCPVFQRGCPPPV